jgi:hypothetical protein
MMKEIQLHSTIMLREKKEEGVPEYAKNHGFSHLSNVLVDDSSIQHSNAISLGGFFDSHNATGFQREQLLAPRYVAVVVA